MSKRKISLRTRIFFSMIVLTIFSLLLILVASYIQYENQSEDYNLRRLIRKETQVKNHLNYLMRRDSSFHQIAAHKEKSQQEFSSIATIHKVEYALYTLSGEPLFFSYVEGVQGHKLAPSILNELFNDQRQRIGLLNEAERGKFQSSYSVLKDYMDQPYVILYFLLMMVITFAFAFLLSGFITRPIESLRKKIDQTGLLKGNERISLNNASKEIDTLVNSYNSMLDALEMSAEKLARSEREQAWQEMAKQVAHEIKNPLTPMRLTIQSFQQRFDPADEGSLEKLNDFSKVLIEQIDTMSNVASAFSDFATLPQPEIIEEDIVEITRLATEIFEASNIQLIAPSTPLLWPIDRTQWIRVLTNLIQNAIQAIPQGREPKIEVRLSRQKDQLEIQITDNGTGISTEDIHLSQSSLQKQVEWGLV
jgi:two-component system nitrogen regulation sensor histidine kinase NtrY